MTDGYARKKIKENAADLASITKKQNYIGGGSISLWYDDGFAGWHTYAHPEHIKYGYLGVACIVTDWINTAGFLTLAQLTEMYDSGLWIIGNHSKTHDLGATDATAKAAIEAAYKTLRYTWGFGLQNPAVKAPNNPNTEIPFIAPGHGYSQAARKYAYLLHPYIRDMQDANSVSGTVPGQTRFAVTSSLEFRNVDANGMTDTRFNNFCKALLDALRLGYHVPILFHNISDTADVWGIDVASYQRVMKYFNDMKIPVVDPGKVIKKHNLLHEGSIGIGSGWVETGSRQGSSGLTTISPFVDTYTIRLIWDGVGITPAEQTQRAINIEGGKTYRVTWWAKGDGDANTRSKITIKTGGAIREGNPLSVVELTHTETALTTSYQRFTGTFVAPKGSIGATLFAEMIVLSGATSRTIYIDGLSVSDDAYEEYNLD